MVAEADYRIKLPVFEGPLDLLLFLIRKNELDIYDIPIESVTKQYLEVLYAMKDLELEVAGEFFVMAATLMEIKSRMLLPKHQQAVDPNADEEELDPRWELVHQLLQYKKFKEASAKLGEMARNTQDMLARPATAFAPLSERPLKSVDRIELWNSFNIVLRRLAEKLVVGEIHAEQVTVADQMEYILARVKTQREFTFSSLFTTKIPLRTLVATFLAMLELTRLKKLTLRQDEAFADIYCTAVEETAPAAISVVETAPTEPAAPAEAVPPPGAAIDAAAPAEPAPPAPVPDQNALETPASPSTVTPHHEESAPPPSL
ncbi:segregation and condensation protein A [Oleiharenicola sp. Vm1]|uniref:segregation and condensation protein A n=1 Tax=Oleiharenicola sp. Vm1 TaxID=3398393 RepID=UPI0039F63838